jgi:diguanylate cyclase (GGDEF)-like protein
MSMPTPPSGTGDEGRGRLGRLKRPTVSAPAAMPAQQNPGFMLDNVTGLPARTYLHDWANEAIERSRPSSNRAVVAFVDIGLLRDVNDSFGADAGDYLLHAIGARLASIDLPGTRVLRYEGAEFALIFEQIVHYEMAETVATFLIDLLTPGFELGAGMITITPYVGMALSTDNYNSTDEFIRDAHQALVRARDQGAGSYAVHDETKRGRYETRIDESRLATAIDNEEFILAYQPIVRLDNNQIIGAEALLRWKSASATNTGVLYPHDFMPLLEKSGLSVRVGEWVIHEGCRQAAEWNRIFPTRPAMFITCNVGARQLAAASFRDKVVESVNATGVQPWQLCLDITEQALRFNRNAAWAALRDLKDMGIKLGLDDFGTGVSSISYLREFTLDLLRIDRVFVTDLEMSKEDRAIVKHIAGLAHDLGLIAIAEGVEKPEQGQVLKSLGVDLGQGYHFGRPMFAKEFAQHLDPSLDDTAEQWNSANVLDYPPA